jgi:hypothetical protein
MANVSSEIPFADHADGAVMLSSLRFGQPLCVQLPIAEIGEPYPGLGLVGTNLMHEMWDMAFPTEGVMENMDPEERSSVRTVLLHDEPAPVVPGSELGVPLPTIEIPMPLGTTMPEVHVQDPAGTLIVSPSTALCVGPFITAFTSCWRQEAAV